MFTAVKDSGQREEMDTGSVRDTREGKGRFDLISPIFLERFAKHTENGAKKYGAMNWTKGQPLSRFMDSALRHLNKFLEGNRDEDHLAAAAWNIQGIIHTEEMIRRGKLPASLADMPNYLAEDPEELEFDWAAEGLPEPAGSWEYTGEHRFPKKGESFLETGGGYWLVGKADRDFRVAEAWILRKTS